MKIRLLFLCVAIFLTFNYGFAQNKSINDVLSVQVRNTGTIFNGDQVEGYYFFYKKDKADRKNNNYGLEILDANLNEVVTKNLVETKYLNLFETAFNGDAIMLKFYDSKERVYKFYQYSTSGELISKKTTEELNKSEAMMNASMLKTGEIGGTTLFAISGKGFVNYLMLKQKKMGYAIKFYPTDKAAKSWTKKSKEKSEFIETGGFFATSDNTLFSLITKRPKLLTVKDSKTYLHAVDITTGKKLFEKQIRGGRYNVFPMKGYYDEKTDEIVVLGQYYNRDEKITSKSLGLFAQRFSATGEVIDEKYLNWNKDMGKALGSEAKEKIANGGNIFFHNMKLLSNGKILGVGEQYKKSVSAASVASAVLGGGAAMSMDVEDLVLFEFNEDFTVNDIQIFEKTKNTIVLPRGYSFAPAFTLAMFLKYYGGFDYRYLQSDKSKDIVTVAYTDYEKKKGEKNETIFGAITSFEGEYSTDKLSLETEASQIYILPAKSGYVLLQEYYKKDKKMDMRLEKINF